ncbi:DUF2442 domain-containing protein [Nodosilinea sp. LEGE 06152]|uniref:DUF2442 domain-containing protein n=1 Tax=Nodosilinea sp. LEGE 06152 TaxID=2777966 RepID=UPI001D14EF16|nr:DUF2442 domain-containing protein [Nodosilinea sp. LEGE 06152]
MNKLQAELRAIDASYDASSNLVVVRLNSGAIFSFPPDIAQGLSNAKSGDLEAVEVTPSGTGLHWEKLDADFSVSGLSNGIFGARARMTSLQEWTKSHQFP